MNRIINMIDKVEQNIQSKNLSADKIAEMSKNLDMQFDEYSILQTRKNLAMMEGKLSLDEAQTAYGYLGETLEHFNGQSLAVKYVLNKLLAELLGSAIAARK